MSCSKAQEFLAKRKIESLQTTNAKQEVIGPQEALRLAREADEIVVARGKRVVRIDLKRETPDDATLQSLILGPTGNLRAPTLRVGRTLLVGFDEPTYRRLLG
ncbi:MAG TPA: ArsC family (seleno)protein [Candidatus Polarisedimenticolia bacterium]|nr:ArsC family (seleno)protein [Candidatus Polarisedimenticolia bacterium]